MRLGSPPLDRSDPLRKRRPFLLSISKQETLSPLLEDCRFGDRELQLGHTELRLQPAQDAGSDHALHLLGLSFSVDRAELGPAYPVSTD